MPVVPMHVDFGARKAISALRARISTITDATGIARCEEPGFAAHDPGEITSAIAAHELTSFIVPPLSDAQLSEAAHLRPPDLSQLLPAPLR